MVTALGTVALAAFALTAWLVAWASLREARKSTKVTLEEQERSRQLAALAPYLTALDELLAFRLKVLYVSTDHKATVQQKIDDINRIHREIGTSGTLWRLHHFAERAQMVPFKDLEDAVLMAHANAVNGKKGGPPWKDPAARLIKHAQEWQADPENRSVTSNRANMDFVDLWDKLGAPARKQPEEAKN